MVGSWVGCRSLAAIGAVTPTRFGTAEILLNLGNCTTMCIWQVFCYYNQYICEGIKLAEKAAPGKKSNPKEVLGVTPESNAAK